MRLLFSLFATVMTLTFPLFCEETPASLRTGLSLEGAAFPDANDTVHTVSPDTRWIVFAYDNDHGKMLNAFFKARPELLRSERVRYVADISGAPYLVRSFFILPALRDLPFPVLIVDDESVSARYRPAGTVSGALLVELDRFKIVAMQPIDEKTFGKLDLLMKE